MAGVEGTAVTAKVAGGFEGQFGRLRHRRRCDLVSPQPPQGSVNGIETRGQNAPGVE